MLSWSRDGLRPWPEPPGQARESFEVPGAWTQGGMTRFDDTRSTTRGKMSAHSDPSKQIGRGSAAVRSSFSDAGRIVQGMLGQRWGAQKCRCDWSRMSQIAKRQRLRPMHDADLAREPRKSARSMTALFGLYGKIHFEGGRLPCSYCGGCGLLCMLDKCDYGQS